MADVLASDLMHAYLMRQEADYLRKREQIPAADSGTSAVREQSRNPDEPAATLGKESDRR